MILAKYSAIQDLKRKWPTSLEIAVKILCALSSPHEANGKNPTDSSQDRALSLR